MFITMVSRSRPGFLAGLDSMVHISEEAKNANIAIPYGIVFATVSSVFLGWGQFFTLFVTQFSKRFERRQRGFGLLHGIGSTEYH
jgi:hypothetical protein